MGSCAPPQPDVVAFRRSIYKSPAQLRSMVEPGLITAAALAAVRTLIAPGVTTAELDAEASRVIGARGALSNFQMVRGYRHTICTSVNEQVVHGIPSSRVLEPGDSRVGAALAKALSDPEPAVRRVGALALGRIGGEGAPGAIVNRLVIYERETAPILDVYRPRGIVVEIDGVGSLDEITDRIIAALEARGLVRAAAA